MAIMNEPPFKLVIVSSGDFFSTYGGGQVYVKNIVNELIKKHDIKLYLFSFDDSSDTIIKEYFESADLYRVPNSASSDILLNILKEIMPDVIHAHGQKILFCKMARQLNIPCIITAHHGGILCPAGSLMNAEDRICATFISHKHCLPCCLRNIRGGKIWHPLMRRIPESFYQEWGRKLERIPFIPFITPLMLTALQIRRKSEEWKSIVSTCTDMIAPSQAIAEAMIRNGMPERKITILPHGVEVPDSTPSFPDTSNGLHFFYVGRISYTKGLHILLQAFSRLKEKNVTLHLIGGVGNKSEQRYMISLMKKYKYDARIIWHGKINSQELPSLIAPFHILVHPAILLEVFGLNIAEALAQGKYILATQCGGAEEQISNGENGWLIPPNSVDHLQKKMDWLIRNLPVRPTEQGPTSLQQHVQSLINLYEKFTH